MVAQVCIFRNAIRRALKGISEALDRLEGSQAGAADTLQACRAVTTVVGQIAQSVHRLQQVSPVAVVSSCSHCICNLLKTHWKRWCNLDGRTNVGLIVECDHCATHDLLACVHCPSES